MESIELGLQRSKKQMFLVGFLIIGLSSFMLSLFWLDSQLENSSNLIKISYSALVLFFYIIGFMMFYVALIKIPLQKRKLLYSLEKNSSEIVKIFHYVVYARIAENNSPNPPGSQHFIQINFKTGKMIQLSYPYEKISPVLALFHEQVPDIF